MFTKVFFCLIAKNYVQMYIFDSSLTDRVKTKFLELNH